MSVTKDYKKLSFVTAEVGKAESGQQPDVDHLLKGASLSLVQLSELGQQARGNVVPLASGDAASNRSSGIFGGTVYQLQDLFKIGSHSRSKKNIQCSSGYAGRAEHWRKIGTPRREAAVALFVENLLGAVAGAILIALPAVLDAAGWLRG